MCPTCVLIPCPFGRTTSTNPAKLLKKLRKQRMAATKGIVKGQK